jgi:hypothetical protein
MPERAMAERPAPRPQSERLENPAALLRSAWRRFILRADAARFSAPETA